MIGIIFDLFVLWSSERRVANFEANKHKMTQKELERETVIMGAMSGYMAVAGIGHLVKGVSNI